MSWLRRRRDRPLPDQPPEAVVVPAGLVAGYFLVQLPFEAACAVVTEALGPEVAGEDLGSAAAAVAAMEVVTWPASAYLVFPVTPTWTAVVNNRRDGSDVADELPALVRSTSATTLRVVDAEESRLVTATGFRVRLGYEARIAELHREGELHRSISCMDDGGRWTHETWGEPLPVEASFDLTAQRRRDRFTRTDLGRLLESLGVTRVDAEVLLSAGRYRLLRVDREVLTRSPRAEAEDPAAGYFRRAQEWLPHLTTQASSVVLDLTKASLLDPDYAGRCAGPLEAARRVVGAAEFTKLADQARQTLEQGKG